MEVKAILCLCVCIVGLSLVLGKECKDRSRLCSYYPRRFCDEKKAKHYQFDFMRRNCANHCGFCNCKNWIYKCCVKDMKTNSPGPNQQGCAQELCYDVEVGSCKRLKKEGKLRCDSDFDKRRCAWTCKACNPKKSPAAPISQCHNIGYGCCWDGSVALGPNGRGCRPCVDTSRHVCQQFKILPCTNTGAYYIRTYLIKHCPDTCGYCPKQQCFDRDSRCASYSRKGYCEDPKWKPYLALSCAKSCGVCQGEDKGMIA